MNAKLRLSLLLLAIGVAIAWPCLFSPQSACAQAYVGHQNLRLAWTGCGEIAGIGPYCFEYESHVVASFVITPSGRVHASWIVNLDHFEGELIESGLRFHGSTSDNEIYNASAEGFPLEFTQTHTVTAISRGSSDNLITHFTYHITINANGEVTVEIVNSWSEYRG